MNAKEKKRKKWTRLEIVVMVILTLIAAAIIIPFWSAIVISFSTNSSYVRNPFALWPEEFTLENYSVLFRQKEGLIIAYVNTIKITVIGTFCAMATMVMAAYVFSREFPGKRFLFMAAIFTMYFSGGGLIPTYLLIKNLNLLNTHAAIILINLASVYNIIIMKNGFEGIPRDLQEAAMIDGANDLKIFTRVMLPLQKPLIATFSLFTVVSFWNIWYWPMLVLNRSELVTLQLFLRTILASASSASESMASEEFSAMVFSQGIQMASVLIVILPIMAVYPFLQKYFVKGMMVGAVKM